MDNIEEFQFKPLTEGLGFHKKVQAIKEEIESGDLVHEELGRELPSMPSPLLEKEKQKSINDLFKSIPSKTAFVEPTKPIASSQQLKKPQAQAKPQAATPVTIQLRAVSTSIPAVIFDGIVSFALSLLFLIALIVVTKIDLPHLIQATGTSLSNQMSLGILYLAISQLYLIIARSFAGQTLGEWAFDVQLGTNTDQADSLFCLQTLVRSLFITATGVFLVPFLALISGIDLAAKVSGLKLYRAE